MAASQDPTLQSVLHQSIHSNVKLSGEGLLSSADPQGQAASVRSMAGIKSGQYLVEIRILDSENPGGARKLLRLGFSTKDGTIFLSAKSDGLCFDSEGSFICGNSCGVSPKFGCNHIVGLLLNLDSSSYGANTVSLFRQGVRVYEAQVPMPLQGKLLFPTVTFKNVVLQLNYGPEPLAQMPFKCRMLQQAIATDIEFALARPKVKGKGSPHQWLLVVPVRAGAATVAGSRVTKLRAKLEPAPVSAPCRIGMLNERLALARARNASDETWFDLNEGSSHPCTDLRARKSPAFSSPNRARQGHSSSDSSSATPAAAAVTPQQQQQVILTPLIAAFGV